MRSGLAIVVVAILLAAPAPAAAYHVDANNGSDVTGDGSAAKPWQTPPQSRAVLAGGDTVRCSTTATTESSREVQNGPANLYGDWVTHAAAKGRSPTVEPVLLGADEKQYIGDDQAGTYDAYLRLVCPGGWSVVRRRATASRVA